MAVGSLVESVGYENIKASIEAVSVGLAWAGCGLLVVEALALLRLALGFWILEETK